MLLVITYFLLELHGYKFRPIVWLGKPFHRCFARFRGQSDFKTSVIDAFATFLLLSYSKILWVSFELLVPTRVYDVYGQCLGLYLFYDAEIEYFGKEHLPYAILALIITLVFNILPLLLLLLYPARWFQRCLNTCRLRWHGLHIFIDAFQGCYKNGTVAGTRDCRYFAAVYLIVRITLLIAYAATQTGLFCAVGLLILIALVALLSIVQPYRADLAVYNNVDIVLILMMVAWYGSLLCTIMAIQTVYIYFKVSLAVSFILAILPHVYLSYIVLQWLFSRMKAQQKLCQMFRTWKRSNQMPLLSDSDLPDRIINPDNYNRCLIDPTAEESGHPSGDDSDNDADETAY